MSMKIKMASDRIAQDMSNTETTVDQALLSVADLMSSLVHARLETGVPAATGQAAILRLAKAQMALVDASSDVLRVHGELKKVSREHAWGDEHECPPMAEKKHLSIVA